MSFKRSLGLAALVSILSSTAMTAVAEGDLTIRPKKLPDLVLGTEDNRYNLSEKRYEMVTGQSYKLKIISSGQTEYAFVAPEFFPTIYLRKIEAGDMEIKAMALTELEFEQEGEAEIYFVPVKPGEYEFYAEGFEEKGMIGVFSVK